MHATRNSQATRGREPGRRSVSARQLRTELGSVELEARRSGGHLETSAPGSIQPEAWINRQSTPRVPPPGRFVIHSASRLVSGWIHP
eukprot:2686705-Prymnesium_polylepis.1